MEVKKEIKKIVEHYGEAQLDIVQEELAELIQAISKYKRYGKNWTFNNVIEEIADVEIMLEQLIYLLSDNGSTHKLRLIINQVKLNKIKRQLERIENGK